MTPTLNRILVTPPLPESDNQKSSGGLFIPQTAREQSKFVQAEVLSVGPDVKRVNEVPSPKPGDSVLYRRDQGNDILDHDGEVIAVLIEDKHIAVVL